MVDRFVEAKLESPRGRSRAEDAQCGRERIRRRRLPRRHGRAHYIVADRVTCPRIYDVRVSPAVQGEVLFVIAGSIYGHILQFQLREYLSLVPGVTDSDLPRPGRGTPSQAIYVSARIHYSPLYAVRLQDLYRLVGRVTLCDGAQV